MTTAHRHSQLDDGRRSELHRYWTERANSELTTALAFEHVLDDLRALGAPRVLLDLTEAAIGEEHNHTDFCLAQARALAPEAAVQLEFHGTRPAEFAGASAEENRILRPVFAGCFSETVAVHVLSASQALIQDPQVRLHNRAHMAEEVRHARLGWAYLAWPGLSSRARAIISAYVPVMTDLLRELWCTTRRPDDAVLAAHGHLSSALVDAAVERALREVITPGLAELHISVPPTD